MNKAPTKGYFNFVGYIKNYKPTNFKKDNVSQNNANYTYSNLFFYMVNGSSGINVNFIDGFSPTKKIYCIKKENNENLVLNFEERFNDFILEEISDFSFIKVYIPNSDGSFQENRFLSEYDAINFIGERLKDNLKIYTSGEIVYTLYKDKIQRNYRMKKFYFLPENDERECKFDFRQDVLLDKDSLNEAQEIVEKDDNLKIKIKSKVLHKISKEKYELCPLDLFYVFHKNEIDKFRKMLDKVFKVEENIIRRITLDGSIFSGKTYSEIELSDEAKELIELGIMSEEEIRKKDIANGYSESNFVDELRISHQLVFKDGKIAKSDDEYTYEDLNNLINSNQIYVEKEINNNSNSNNNSILSDNDVDDFLYGSKDTKNNNDDFYSAEQGITDDDLPF